MDSKFLIKNTTPRDGIYRSGGVDKIMKPGEQAYLDFPPEFHSVEIKVIEMK
jgi:hypothetical protein